MTKPRKPRTDSTENLVRIFAGAKIELAPPSHVQLDDASWPFWHNLVAEYARADWTAHQLSIAALLARTMASLEAEQRAQRAEGCVVTKLNGDSAQNPRNRVVASLTGQVLAYRRSLALTGRTKAGRSEEATRQREANRRVEHRLRGSTRDDLLA